MKAILTTLAILGLSISSSQATFMNLADCGDLIGYTDGAGVFNSDGKDKADYKGGDKYADWAIDQIITEGLAEPEVSDFTKRDTSTPLVSLGPDTGFVMVHWGGGKSGDHEFELYSVTDCAAGLYYIPAPSKNGISWIGKFGTGEIPPPSVPDGGTTAALLGLALLGMVPLKKLMSRKG